MKNAGYWLRHRLRRAQSCFSPRATTPEQVSHIGNQAGGRVAFFLHTDDFWRDYNEMKSRKVQFVRGPKEETYGTVAVFEDLYGNKWDLLELKQKPYS